MNSPYSCVIYWQGLYKRGETRGCFTVGLFEATAIIIIMLRPT